MLCEIAGDCAPDCGAGKRQLGLLAEDGRLLMTAKGGTDFAGAVVDLLPHCGKTVEADGLLIENPAMTLYFVQGLRLEGETAFTPADAFGKAFAAEHGEGDWYRMHPLVDEVIAKNGKLGDPKLKLEE